MHSRPQATGRRHRGLTLVMAAAIALPLLSASCVITDDEDLETSVVMRFDEDGFTAVISLGRPVCLPVDEADAYYIMDRSDCGCRGELTLVGSYWQYPEYIAHEGCSIRIDVYTGDVECYR